MRLSDEAFRIKAGTGVMRGINRDLSVTAGAALALGLADPPERKALPGHHLVYVIGAPGVGKSTLMAHLTLDIMVAQLHTEPFGHVLWRHDVVELGIRRADFSGTDALPMNVQPKVERWLADEGLDYPLVIGEGDRLGNVKFLRAAREAGWIVHLVVMQLPAEALNLRHAGRGKAQSESWREGRKTKVRNTASWAVGEGIHVLSMPASRLPGQLAGQVFKHIPELERLRGRAR